MAAAIASAIPATAQAAAHPAWRIAYTLPGGTVTVLDGIAAASQNDAWAFGVTYTVGGEINELTGWGDHRWAAGLSRHWSDHLVPANPSALALTTGYLTYDYRYGVWAGAYLRWTGGHWYSLPLTTGADGNDIVEGLAAVPDFGNRMGLNSDHSFIAEYRA